MSLVLLAGAAMPTWAQTARRVYTQRTTQERRYDNTRRADYDRNGQRVYDRRDDDRSVWDQSRDKITVAGGAGAGALLGALTGGKKGAIIGALIGAGGAAVYTYGVRDDDDRNDRRYERRR